MSHANHSWKLGRNPPLIRPHSLAKHRVIRSYLEKYIGVLTSNKRMDSFKLTLVDGFAGGGKYLDSKTKEERSGSPLIMLEAMKEAERKARIGRKKDFKLDVEFFFVETKKHAIEYLKNTIEQSEYAPLLSNRIHLIHGDFISNAPKIAGHVKKRGRAGRAIFLLDQFGYIEVPMLSIRSILSQLDKAEVILTFATDWLIDYLDSSDETRRRLERVGLVLPEVGSSKDNPNWRRGIQYALHKEIPSQTCAKHYTPFFIRSNDAHRDFWLIHLSGHSRARDVMVGLHWEQSTDFAHYGGAGLNMLGYDQTKDQVFTGQGYLPGFLFDDSALQASRDELLQQLPERLFSFRNGISFGDLFSTLTNETPVTSEIMRSVLTELAQSGDIIVKDELGNSKRSKVVTGRSDIILPSRQQKLTF